MELWKQVPRVCASEKLGGAKRRIVFFLFIAENEEEGSVIWVGNLYAYNLSEYADR